MTIVCLSWMWHEMDTCQNRLSDWTTYFTLHSACHTNSQNTMKMKHSCICKSHDLQVKLQLKSLNCWPTIFVYCQCLMVLLVLNHHSDPLTHDDTLCSQNCRHFLVVKLSNLVCNVYPRDMHSSGQTGISRRWLAENIGHLLDRWRCIFIVWQLRMTTGSSSWSLICQNTSPVQICECPWSWQNR